MFWSPYGLEMTSAGPTRKSPMLLVTYPLMINFLVPYIIKLYR